MTKRLLLILMCCASVLTVGRALAQGSDDRMPSEDMIWSGGARPQAVDTNVGAWVLTGAGVASFGVGLTLFLVAHGEYDELSDPVRDAEGRVRGVTQREVAKEEQQIAGRVQTGAILMGVGVLAGVGGALWNAFDTPSESKASPFDSAPIQPFGWFGVGEFANAPVGLSYSGKF